MAKRIQGKEVSDEDKKMKVNRETLRETLHIFSYVRPYRAYFIVGLVFLVLSSITSLTFPLITGKLVDIMMGNTDWVLNSLNQVVLALFGVLVLQGIFSFLRIWLFAVVSQKAMADLRTDIFSRVITLDMTFFEKRRVGELTSRLTSDVSQLQDVLSVTLAEFFRQISTLLIGVGIIVYIQPKLTGFMLATFPVLVVASFIFGKYIRKLSKLAQDELAAANVIAEETLQSINVVKSFTNEMFEMRRYRKALEGVVSNSLTAAKYRGVFVSFIIFVLFGGIVGVIWYGATLVQAGEMTAGDLISFIIYTTFIGGSVGGLGDIYGQLQKTIGSSERIREILREKPELVPSEDAVVRMRGEVAFEDVSFRYPTRRDVEVLDKVNLSVKPGEKVALVGHSGAGKSTIIQLLMGYYPLDGGRILIDGHKVSEMDRVQLRGNIGLVPQEVMLFGGTVRENIAYGRPGATEAEIEKAAAQANALNFVRAFPEGLETVVGERGVKLSGGQKQRVAIARAILKDPAILVLDEATSSLDSESEQLVQEALDELMKGRTTFIIAHRLATIRKADKILVLSEGHIIEEGTHEELTGRDDGTYRKYLELQMQSWDAE